jgi:hypothetical protein
MTSLETQPPAAAPAARRGGMRAFVGMVALDVVLPLALFYGLRLAGGEPVARPGPGRRGAAGLETLGAFTLSILAAGTASAC